jgi:hypothetical protein
VIGLLYQLANYKMLDYKVIPEDIAKTSLPQTWHTPRGTKIGGKQVQDVEVHSYNSYKKPIEDTEEPPKPIQSTLYNPIRCEMPSPLLLHQPLKDALPNSMMVDFLTEEVQNTQLVPTKFGQYPRGCVLSYHQRVSSEYIINNYADTTFPTLPVANKMYSNVAICLTESQTALMQELELTNDQIINFEIETRVQSSSSLWHRLRKGRITASIIGSVIKRKKRRCI